MIVRTWHGCVPLEHADGFAKHLEKTGVEHSKSIPGNIGVFVRRETQGGWEHFFLATYTGRISSRCRRLLEKTITWRSPTRMTKSLNYFLILTFSSM